MSLRRSQFASIAKMAKSKAKSKPKRTAQPSTEPTKTRFVLTPEHKRFLNERAEEHAAAIATQKPGIVAKAIEELLRAFSITRKDEIKQVSKASSITAVVCTSTDVRVRVIFSRS